MAPILIDKRDLLKLSLLSILITATFFSGGFIFGYEKATTIFQTASEVKALTLPHDDDVEHAREQQNPNVIAAGAEIDVDQPDSVSIVEITTETLVNDGVADNNISVEDDAISVKTSAASSASENAIVDSQPSNTNSLTTKQFISLSTLTGDELNKIKYSIQVGMYGRLSNAETVKETLQRNNIDAYVSAYSNNKNETRYNVRVGYFSDKKIALVALREYRETKKSDGYLVKFASENIVDLAKLENEKTSGDEAENDTTSNLTSTESPVEKVSQTEIVSPANNVSTNSL